MEMNKTKKKEENQMNLCMIIIIVKARYFYQKFALDLCKERSWGPPKSEAESSLCFAVVADESRVSVRLAAEGASADSILKALRDWWQPNGAGQLKFAGKAKKPI